jgi:HAD superfamily hydrolase (TIGR01662 family)
MIKGIIFDLGGTLLHFQGDPKAAEQQGAEAIAEWLIKKKRVKLNAPALAAAIVSARKESFAKARETLRPTLAKDAILTALQRVNAPPRAAGFAQAAVKIFFQGEEKAHVLLPDAPDTLKSLKARGIKCALLSNASDDALIQRLVNRSGLRPYLSPVFSSAGLGWQKPRAEPFLLIAQRWQLPPQRIAVVGDTLSADIQGAHNAGMTGILVTRVENPRNNKNRHIKPDVTIATLADLPEILAL